MSEENAPFGGASLLGRATSAVVRLIGLGVLVLGATIGYRVVTEAWFLYQSPDRIERFAQAIESGSHIDRMLAPPARTGATAPGGFVSPADPASEAGEEEPIARPIPAQSGSGFRMSYFLAWVIGLLLLMLLGRISVWMMKTGGELALYDTQVRGFARALVQAARARDPGRGRDA